jgi:hypothetical protein
MTREERWDTALGHLVVLLGNVGLSIYIYRDRPGLVAKFS